MVSMGRRPAGSTRISMPAAVWLTVTLVPVSARKPVIPGAMGGSRSTGSGQRKMCRQIRFPLCVLPPHQRSSRIASPRVLGWMVAGCRVGERHGRESPRVGRDPVFVRRQERVAAGHVYALAHFVQEDADHRQPCGVGWFDEAVRPRSHVQQPVSVAHRAADQGLNAQFERLGRTLGFVSPLTARRGAGPPRPEILERRSRMSRAR